MNTMTRQQRDEAIRQWAQEEHTTPAARAIEVIRAEDDEAPDPIEIAREDYMLGMKVRDIATKLGVHPVEVRGWLGFK